MRNVLLATALTLSLTGCVTHNETHLTRTGPTKLQIRAAAFLDHTRDVLDVFRQDWKAAQYETEEIAKVQADVDKFDLHVPDTQLQAEIDNLVIDLESMAGKDSEVFHNYELM